MLTEPERFSQVRWLTTSVCVLTILGACVLLGYGLLGDGTSARAWMMVAGGFTLFAAISVMALMALVVKIESTLARQLTELRNLREAVRQQIPSLESIAESTQLSDAARSLAHRDREVETLRQAIAEDIRRGRWEAAINLIDGMETRFGHKEEAESIREDLDRVRDNAIQARLAQAIEKIEVDFQAHNWEHASAEIDRLKSALPGNARVAGLMDRMNSLKEEHKQELRKAWDEAVRRSDTDLAIEILRELDQYLSSAEAHELQTSARDVFKEKLLQLGVQFRFAVTEKRWQDALTSGLELVRDFPNARMATEVREALDTLRERAKQAVEGHTPEPAGRQQ